MGPLWISRVTRGLNRERAVTALLSRAYGAALDVVYGDRGIAWTFNGEPLRIHPRLRGKMPPVNEPELFAFLKAGIKPGQVVFDVGTFIGTYAVLEATWAGPTGRVVAFEPTARNWPFIEAHLTMNRVRDRVELIRAAAGDTPGHITFHQHTRDSDQNSVLQLMNPSASTATTVPMVTLDEISERLGLVPDWIRMDVQGFEMNVLRGARTLLSRADRFPRIVVEMHPGLWALNGFGAEQVSADLRSMGLVVKPLGTSTELFPDGGHVELVRA